MKNKNKKSLKEKIKELIDLALETNSPPLYKDTDKEHFHKKVERHIDDFIKELKKEIIPCVSGDYEKLCKYCREDIKFINKLSGFEEENE